MKALPPYFHYSLGVYICVIYFTKSKWMPGSVPILNLPKKCIVSSSKDISVIIFYLLWIHLLNLLEFTYFGYGPFLANWISIFNFAYILTEKPRLSAENIGIKVCSLFVAFCLVLVTFCLLVEEKFWIIFLE